MLPQLEALMLENRWTVKLHDNDIVSILVDQFEAYDKLFDLAAFISDNMHLGIARV